MAISHVQDACNAASGASATVTLSATGAGNALIMPTRVFSSGSAGFTSSVTGGGTWTFAGSANNGAPPGIAFGGGTPSSAFIDYILAASPVTSVTLTAGAGNYTEPAVGEFSGVGLAAAGGTASGSSSAPSAPSLAYGNGDLIVMIAYPDSGINFAGVPSGFTAFANFGDNVNWACWQVMTGGGTLAATWTDSAPNWIVAAQVFQVPGSQPASPAPPSPSSGGIMGWQMLPVPGRVSSAG